MGRLYDIIQKHIDDQAYPTSVRQVALALGVSPTTVSNWRNITELPTIQNLEAVARVTGVRYEDVFYAAAFDAGYIVEDIADIPDTPEAVGGVAQVSDIAARKGNPRLPK